MNNQPLPMAGKRTSETLRIALTARDFQEEMGEDHYGLRNLITENQQRTPLTKLAHSLANREDYKMEIFSRLYINKIVAGHGVPVSIIFDRDSKFHIAILANRYINH
ncbi:hypothetical protein Tco_1364263 [Tanacetum coccineum]